MGELYPKKTGESVVYLDENATKVFKLKDPYAKRALKRGVEPEDVIYEHLVHNIFFPETHQTFEGITEGIEGIRIVLSQLFVPSVHRPSAKQVEQVLARKGLFRESGYHFGNDYISVTDVEGDNVLLGEDGQVLFIDPIIDFKRPVSEILSLMFNEYKILK